MDKVPGLFDAESLEELRKKQEDLKAQRVKRRRRGTTNEVCICGHPINNHHDFSENGTYTCTPGRTECWCKKPDPVLTTDNLRMFMYGTDGHGGKHALGLGMRSCALNGVKMQWMKHEMHCDKCKNVLDPGDCFPVAVSSADRMSTTTTSLNILICRGCYEAWL